MHSRGVSVSRSVRYAAAVVAVAPLGLLLWPAARAAANHPSAFTDQLFDPAEIVLEAGESTTLIADEAQVPIFDGDPTEMWLYNGSFPGPVIRQIASDAGPAPVTVNVTNNLDGKGPLTLHHHGNHSTPTNDGRPHNDALVLDAEIPEGETRAYEFE
ncbi:MAG: multicopper oxidase domain-containing protein, partial [Acidimicrobiia bacterium]|nr:multicopper oxidase domain-containing protein [Acidimicrobiia bacterium]